MKSILNAIIVAALIVGGLYIFGLARNEQRDKRVHDIIEAGQRAAWEIQWQAGQRAARERLASRR